MAHVHISFMFKHKCNTGYVASIPKVESNKSPHDMEIYHLYICNQDSCTREIDRVYWLIKRNFPQIKLLNKNMVKDENEIKFKRRLYYLQNKETKRESMKKWRMNNIQQAKNTSANWRENNHEYLQYLKRCYAINNRSKCYQTVNNWRKNHLEYYREYYKKYRLQNADKIREIEKRSRMKKIKSHMISI